MSKSTRVTRASINGIRQKLNVRGKDPAFEYRIVNDIDDRIQEFIDRGYEIVTDTTVQVGDKRVANPTQEGTPAKVSVGQGVKAFVMRIKKEFYEEDKQTHNATLDELEGQLRRTAKEEGLYGDIKTTR
jgi:hypothetical protein